ncbi:hypothetical protein [Parenemella sanctibonifatiensis]|nr:hypothetical protein [Parenemella sanctibonifatiensis]
MRRRLGKARTIATRASYVGLLTSLGFSMSGVFGWGYPELSWFFPAQVILTVTAAALAVLALPRSGLALLIAGVVLAYSAGCLVYLTLATVAWCRPLTMDQDRERRLIVIDHSSTSVHCIGEESGERVVSFNHILQRGVSPRG